LESGKFLLSQEFYFDVATPSRKAQEGDRKPGTRKASSLVVEVLFGFLRSFNWRKAG